MFFDIPQNLILTVAGAFMLGWILSAISTALGSKQRAKKRDPRDDRIRSLEAEIRVAQIELTKTQEKLERLQADFETVNEDVEKRDNVINHQQEQTDKLKKDLQDSVKKTCELRAELTERAAESVKSEVKLREVETELSVAQASTDMIATGALDYSLTPDDASESSDVDEMTSHRGATSRNRRR